MTTATATAAKITARNIRQAMVTAAPPLDYNAGVARTLGVKDKLVSEWVNGKAIPNLPHQRALEQAFKKPFGWFTADHEQL